MKHLEFEEIMNNPTKIIDIINGWKNKHVLVVGDVMLDENYYGNAFTMPPEGPFPDFKTDNIHYNLGGAGNVASNIAHLGGIPILAGVVGRDQYGEIVKDNFVRLVSQSTDYSENPHCLEALVTDETRITTRKTRFYTTTPKLQQFGIRVSSEITAPIPESVENELLDRIKNLNPPPEAVVFSDYAKGTLTKRTILSVMNFAKDQEIPVIVDPKNVYVEYNGADIFKPNLIELQQMFPDYEDNFEKAKALLAKGYFKNVALTAGNEGIYLFTSEKLPAQVKAVHVPTKRQDVYNVSGAGDTVTAVFALGMAAGVKTSPHVAALANLAAGTVISKEGVVPAYVKELKKEIEEYS